MEKVNIGEWVNKETEPRGKAFREAIHVVLAAIANSSNLNTEMIMKGGILLSIKYGSTRYTQDIDFSTPKEISQFNIDHFLSEFKQSLALSVEDLDYGIDCRIQSHRVKPPSPDATFPTLKLNIGYAYKDDQRSHRRLLVKNSSDIVELDYSFNELTDEIDILTLSEGTLSAYGLSDLIAEKFRALLQQETRNRYRRQDIYDLYFLLKKYDKQTSSKKKKILASFIKKSESRGLSVNKESLASEEIKRRSQKEYALLQAEIEEELPDFEEAYEFVRKFYEALPWDSKRK
jgi:hypothetical protein